jgi:GntR family transcriptional regulator
MNALPAAQIDRASPVPFYFQLARLLEEEITSGRWAPGHQVASEPSIGDHFGLSRSTVRQALLRLESEGLIQRQKGRGTFVADARSRSWLLQSSEGFFQEEVDRLGFKVTTRILEAKVTSLPGWAAEALRLPKGDEGAVLKRLRWLEGLLALYTVNYLPVALAGTVMSLDANDSLYEHLEEKEGLRVFGGRRVVEAVAAKERLARLLEVPPNAPLAYIESVSWDANLQPFDCYQTWLRTDRMRIEVQVERSHPSSGA